MCCFDLSASAETRGQVAFGGVPVPGATVTASQGEKNFVAITDLMGMYVLPDLTEGMWTIEIEMLGFAKVSGDPSTSVWELKMLPMSEIKAEVEHTEAAAATAAAAPSAAPAAGANRQTAMNPLMRLRAGEPATRLQTRSWTRSSPASLPGTRAY